MALNLYKIFRGTTADDGTGTPARTAAEGINNNMDLINNDLTRIDTASEKVANKAINLDAPNNTNYPTTQAVTNAIGSIESNANTYTDTQLTSYQIKSEKGAASGYAPLDATGLVPTAHLPAYVEEIIEGTYVNSTTFNNTSGTAVTPATNKLYLDTTTSKVYRWSGSQYVEIVASPGTTDEVVEGATNLYFTGERVRNTLLTGLSTVVSSAIAAGDTIIAAFGKLQAQISGVKTDLGTKLDKGTYTGTATDLETLANSKETPAGAQAKADAKVEDAIADGVINKAPSQNAVFDALAGKANAGDAYKYLGELNNTHDLNTIIANNTKNGYYRIHVDARATDQPANMPPGYVIVTNGGYASLYITYAGAASTVTASIADASGVIHTHIHNVGWRSTVPKEHQINGTRIEATVTGLATPVNAAFTAGSGTLAAATYYYRVTATNAYGETLPSTETSFTLTATGGVNVNWGAVTGATGYKVYGRSTGAEQLIASVGNVTTYLDDGSITPSGAMPTANSTGNYKIDYTAASVLYLTLNVGTTIEDINFPTGTNTKTIELVVKGSVALKLPAYWEARPSNDAYSGTVRNHFVVSFHNGDTGSEKVIYSLENLAT